eukprot:364743-Chlamydomonas_euryale.AAC.74
MISVLGTLLCLLGRRMIAGCHALASYNHRFSAGVGPLPQQSVEGMTAPLVARLWARVLCSF